MQPHLVILRTLAVIALVAVIELGVAPVGHAQTWLAPTDPERGMLGPIDAIGAVVWSHGRSVDAEDFAAPAPPYLTRLRNGGWDTFRFNRRRDGDTLARSSRALVEDVHRLKQQGYRRVVLAGQSFGAFLALLGADASDEVDAVIATAPAAYGNYAEHYDTWRANATRLYPVLQRVIRARVMLFYFNGDEFDPGGRGERSRAILAERHLDFLVVDQPQRLETHWAASTPLFAELYGDCILAFLDARRFAPGARCDGGTYWAAAPPPVHDGGAQASASTGMAAR